jgi:hypothetical protein
MASTIWSGETTFEAPSGSQTVVPIRVPHRGILRSYRLVQVDGAEAGVTAADLYTSNQATAPNSTLPEEAFHLVNMADTGDVVTDPDVSGILENKTAELAYINRDGTPTNPQRYLYLKITPAGTGAKNFVFSVTIEVPKLG